MKRLQLRWRLRSLLWLVLIAGVILGIIRYGQDQAARTKPVMPLTIKDGDGFAPGMKFVIYRRGKTDQNRRAIKAGDPGRRQGRIVRDGVPIGTDHKTPLFVEFS